MFSKDYEREKQLKESEQFLNELQEELQPLQEMGFLVRRRDNAGFLIEVRTKEKPHEKSYPHVHLYSNDKTKVVSMFITKEVPKKVSDLRFDKSTLKNGNFDSDFLKRVVDWANKKYLPDDNLPTRWDQLKNYYESLQTDPDEEVIYPSKTELEI